MFAMQPIAGTSMVRPEMLVPTIVARSVSVARTVVALSVVLTAMLNGGPGVTPIHALIAASGSPRRGEPGDKRWLSDRTDGKEAHRQGNDEQEPDRCHLERVHQPFVGHGDPGSESVHRSEEDSNAGGSGRERGREPTGICHVCKFTAARPMGNVFG